MRTILAHPATEGFTLERAAVGLIAFTDSRPSEARGLRWEDWNRSKDQVDIVRAVWRAIEQTTKTRKSIRLFHVTDELRTILLELWKPQGSPISGYILARPNGERVNLDNMSKRDIIPALRKAAISRHGFHSLRRVHGPIVREQSGSSDTTSKALCNSEDKHYIKPTKVLPDVRKAVNDGLRGRVK